MFDTNALIVSVMTFEKIEILLFIFLCLELFVKVFLELPVFYSCIFSNIYFEHYWPVQKI